MDQAEILSVESRRRIFECVNEHPGAHLRDISRRTSLPLGTTLYHLDHLESRGLVAARRDGRYKRYFAGMTMGRREKDLISVLRHDAPRRIVRALLEHGPRTQRQLCGLVGLSRSTLSFHVNQLVERGVARRIDGRPENHYLLDDPPMAKELLDKYGASLAPEPVRRLVVEGPRAPAPPEPAAKIAG